MKLTMIFVDTFRRHVNCIMKNSLYNSTLPNFLVSVDYSLQSREWWKSVSWSWVMGQIGHHFCMVHVGQWPIDPWRNNCAAACIIKYTTYTEKLCSSWHSCYFYGAKTVRTAFSVYLKNQATYFSFPLRLATT